MTTPLQLTTPSPGITVLNDLQTQTQPLRIGCGASLHLAQKVATCAWVIETPNNSQIKAHANILNISSFTTYRSELEGIYRSLQHIQTLAMEPPHIQQWCDNNAAIDNAAKNFITPSQMTRLDEDILLAISALRQKYSPCVITQTHVYGHQDSRPAWQLPASPSTSSKASFSLLDSAIFTSSHVRSSCPDSQLNILSDTIAGAAAADVIWGSYPTTPTIAPPIPGSKVLLRVGETWITYHISKYITNAFHLMAI
jgi:hypothetical protein